MSTHPRYNNAIYSTSRHVVVFERRHDRRGPCSWIGNILWLVLGGWHLFLSWFTVGLVLRCTLILCPCGLQVIKISFFLLFPFGKQLVRDESYENCLCCNCCLNIVWVISVGWILALQAAITGILLMLTFIGIPFGIQCCKLARISFWPFGMDLSAEVREETIVTTHYGTL